MGGAPSRTAVVAAHSERVAGARAEQQHQCGGSEHLSDTHSGPTPHNESTSGVSSPSGGSARVLVAPSGGANKVTRASEKNTDVNSRGTCYFCHLYRGGTSLVRFDRAAIICRDIVLGIG